MLKKKMSKDSLSNYYNENVEVETNMDKLNNTENYEKNSTLINQVSIEEESAKILNAINGNNFDRDNFLIMLLLKTGIRLREVSSIKIRDVKVEEGILEINFSKLNPRNLYLTKEVKIALKKWLKMREQILNNSNVSVDELFLNNKGDNGLSSFAIEKLVKTYLAKAGITATTAMYLRHNCIRNLIFMSGLRAGELSEIQGYLVTSKYCDVYISKDNRDISSLSHNDDFDSSDDTESDTESITESDTESDT